MDAKHGCRPCSRRLCWPCWEEELLPSCRWLRRVHSLCVPCCQASPAPTPLLCAFCGLVNVRSSHKVSCELHTSLEHVVQRDCWFRVRHSERWLTVSTIVCGAALRAFVVRHREKWCGLQMRCSKFGLELRLKLLLASRVSR